MNNSQEQSLLCPGCCSLFSAACFPSIEVEPFDRAVGVP